MLKNFVIKNWKTSFNIQWISFSIFIILAFIYYWDKPAHIYFNRSLRIINFQYAFSMIMTCLFILFSFIMLIYPLLFALQTYYVWNQKGNIKKSILLIILYLMSIVSILSLYILNSSQAIKGLHTFN